MSDKPCYIIKDGKTTKYMNDVFHPELDYNFATFSQEAARRFATLHSAYDALISWSLVLQQPISPGTEIFILEKTISTKLLHRYGNSQIDPTPPIQPWRP